MKLLWIIVIVGLAILAIAFAVVLWQHPDGAGQFEYAFGIAPPSGVANIVAYRRGGFPDTFVLLRFTADRAAIDETVASRPLELDPNVVDDRLRTHNDLPRFWRSIFSDYFDYGGKDWQIPAKLVAPEVYEWRGSHPKLTLVKLLWDAHTGRAFALYTIG